MKTKEIIRRADKLAKPFRVVDGEKFHLKDIDPADTLAFDSEDKPRSKEALAMGIDALAELQEILYAQSRWAVLLIFQAMDAAASESSIVATMRRRWSSAFIAKSSIGRGCRRSSSPRTSGRIATRTYDTSSDTWRGTASSSASSFSTSRGRSNGSVSSSDSKLRRRTGSSRPTTSRSVSSGTTTCRPTRS